MTAKKHEHSGVLEVLKKGIELESYGIKFYSKSSETVSDPKGKQTLNFLAHEEREHLNFIQELQKIFEDGGASGLEKTVSSHLERIHEKVFPELGEYLKDVKKSSGDKQILEEALEIEKKSVALYKSQIEASKNENVKKIFEILVKEEQGHLTLVEQMQDYMVLNGVWTGLDEYFANE